MLRGGKPLAVGKELTSKSFSTVLKPRKNARITHANVAPSHSHLFSEDFLRFLRSVSGEFQPEYRRLLSKRLEWQQLRDAGKPLTFRDDTAWIRQDKSWVGPAVVPELNCRWVEITGPAGDAKMVINALNSGANGYMADLEDAQTPDWNGIITGHQNLYQAVRGDLTFSKQGADGKVLQDYKINANPSTLHVRCRGMHMFEKNVIDEGGRPMPASVFDMAMYMYHNADILLKNGLRPLFYVPKLQTFEEATLIHDVLQQIELQLGLPYGTSRVTALIETLQGLTEAEEIGFALGPYWAALNCGRWDYIFSVIKAQSNNPDHIFPDRGSLTMEVPFMTQYMQRIVQVCHRRGVHAMGGMSAFIPGKDAAENKKIMEKVAADKEFEISHGCDGAWVAHPGMVKSIHDVFKTKLNGKPNQIDAQVNRDVIISPQHCMESPARPTDVARFTEAGLRTNISVGIQYLSSWLSGTGAAAINGLMEDMATAEISRTQVWQWLHHKQSITLASGVEKPLDRPLYDSICQSVLAQLRRDVEGTDAKPWEKEKSLAFLAQGADLFNNLVTAPTLQTFVQDSGYKLLNKDVEKPTSLKTNFVAYQPPAEDIRKLQGSRPDLTLDARLAITRGLTFNAKMGEVRRDGMVAHGNFIGTPNGHSARNVIEGGLGLSWPYIGGWELNARGLVGLEQPMPDTLAVNFHEQGDLARVINRFLDVADKVQHLEFQDKLAKIAKLPKEKQDGARKKLIDEQIDYLTQPILADLEQGWGDPKKVFHSVIRCLQHGVNIMHIEDQYSLKRCGHLGGKGLDDINSWIITMKAANLAATLFADVNRDGPKQNVNFVARTDALSAEFIQYSHHMHDKSHPDHGFIDWDRGFTPDGRYLYLKKGKNPQTGRKYGLEHSARRCAEIVKNGLASHVWMETPDANIADAKNFIDLVNEHLAPYGMFSRGLYNHSPSFVWDVNFFLESGGIAKKVGEYIEGVIKPALDKSEISLEKAHWLVKQFLKNQGDRVRGDYCFGDDNISQILGNGLDLARGENDWRGQIDQQMKLLSELGPSLQTYKAQKELNRILDLGYRPLRHITNIIVAQRLKNFKDRLSDVGFEVHLCTLPLYPSDAYTASRLARGMTETGIHDFVINQRVARKYADATGKLTSFFHQRSTGTGYEVAINSSVGTSNTDILHGSTEVADQKKEESLRAKNDGPVPKY